MIRRHGDCDFFLIDQVRHAALSAALGRWVGNQRFAAPLPLRPFLSGIELHDSGWALHDRHPTVNAQGWPTNVFETPLQLEMEIRSLCTDLAIRADLYAGLLVSLHGLALSRYAKPGQDAPHELFVLNKFQHRQVEIQEDLRRQLNMRTDLPLHFGLAEPGRSAEEDLLSCNFHLLQLLDVLSLNICLDKTTFSSLDEVPPAPGLRPVTVRMSRPEPGIWTVDPWPFARPQIPVQVVGRRVPLTTYADDESLRRVFATAPEVRLTAILHGK
jgi:Protein of unknown function (DUF3891)